MQPQEFGGVLPISCLQHVQDGKMLGTGLRHARTSATELKLRHAPQPRLLLYGLEDKAIVGALADGLVEVDIDLNEPLKRVGVHGTRKQGRVRPSDLGEFGRVRPEGWVEDGGWFDLHPESVAFFVDLGIV